MIARSGVLQARRRKQANKQQAAPDPACRSIKPASDDSGIALNGTGPPNGKWARLDNLQSLL